MSRAVAARDTSGLEMVQAERQAAAWDPLQVNGRRGWERQPAVRACSPVRAEPLEALFLAAFRDRLLEVPIHRTGSIPGLVRSAAGEIAGFDESVHRIRSCGICRRGRCNQEERRSNQLFHVKSPSPLPI